jgi:hypothetical protein
MTDTLVRLNSHVVGTGHEGGWNRELDGDFALHDPQAQSVIHPWEAFGGIDTKYNPGYPDLQRAWPSPRSCCHQVPARPVRRRPGRGARRLLARDEGLAARRRRIPVDPGRRRHRTHRPGRGLDLFGRYAPDGIVGPWGEKEPSYFTVKEIWPPVQIDAPVLDARFNGALKLANEFDFTTLAAVRFRWEWIRFASANGRHLQPDVLIVNEGAPFLQRARGWRTFRPRASSSRPATSASCMPFPRWVPRARRPTSPDRPASPRSRRAATRADCC